MFHFNKEENEEDYIKVQGGRWLWRFIIYSSKNWNGKLAKIDALK